VEIVQDLLGLEEARALQLRLTRELPWEQRDVVLFGRRIPQPRLIAWAGELPYRYSGQTLEPRPLGALGADGRDLLDRVSRAAAAPFNHVLVNRYRSGQDSMGLHADDEPELGADPVVATLSLGVSRLFVVAPRRSRTPGPAKLRLSLEAGSLLVMGGTCQRHYRHGVPRAPGAAGERISLTFRQILRAPLG
jgi:alkylated DNA repair dioxygenase AlkB